MTEDQWNLIDDLLVEFGQPRTAGPPAEWFCIGPDTQAAIAALWEFAEAKDATAKWKANLAPTETEAELIRRAIDGETIGSGAKQIALLVAQLRKWQSIAKIRGHAIREIHSQTDRIAMVEHNGAEMRAELIEHALHERQVSFEHSFYSRKLAEAADARGQNELTPETEPEE